MDRTFTSRFRVRLKKRELALAAVIVFLVLAVPLGFIVHGVVQERDRNLAKLRTIRSDHIRAIQFRTQHGEREGPDCFWVRELDSITRIATTLRQADTKLQPVGHRRSKLDFAMIVHFTNDSPRKFLGDIYFKYPNHVFLNTSYWERGHLGSGSWTRPDFLPVRIPDWALWVLREFEMHGCLAEQ